MAQAAKRASEAFAASDFPKALSDYTHALLEHPTSPDYFTQRSIIFTRLRPPRYDLALKDAEYAVLLGYKRARREKILAAQQRRVVALHGLGRYADAKFILTTMQSWRPKDDKPAQMEGNMWMAKVDSKLKNVPDTEKVATVKEKPEIELPSETQLVKQLKAQFDESGKFRLEGEDNIEPSDTSADATAAPTLGESSGTKVDKGTGSTTVSDAPVATNIRHEWYQNAQSVTLTLYAKGVPKDAADVEIQEDSIHISFPHPSNLTTTFTFSLDPLYALIDPSQSRYAVLSTKVELTLRKAQPGQKWHTLEGTTPLKDRTANQPDTTSSSDAVKAAAASGLPSRQPMASSSESPSDASGPSYPTSSRNGPKDWDKLANDLHAQSKTTKGKAKADKTKDNQKTGSEIEGEGEDNDEAEDVDSDYDETGDPLDAFFKKLYAGSDADTRRAMMKSFYESNGTALSTNWAEVGKKKVEAVKSSKD